MMAEQEPATTIWLNVHGPLELARDAGGPVTPPTSLRAKHILAVMATVPELTWRTLIETLWPDEARTYQGQVRDALDNRLSQELRKARAAFGLDTDSGFLYAHGGTVRRAADDRVAVVSDYDDFHRLSRSDDPADRYAALALVRGILAAHLPDVPQDDPKQAWLTRQREQQREDIIDILKRLDSDASPDDLTVRCQAVLDRRYRLPASVITKPQSRPTGHQAPQQPTLSEPSSPMALIDPRDPTTRPLYLTFVEEVKIACEEGLATAYAKGRVPSLRSLASEMFVGETFLERTEALLEWGIKQVEKDDLRRKGIEELLDLGPLRKQSWEVRRPRARDYRLQEPRGRREDWGAEEDVIFKQLAQLFTTLAGKYRIDT